MDEFRYRDIVEFDKEHGTNFIEQLEDVCREYAIRKQGKGVFGQFKTDWIRSLTYALRQTLRYVGFGYESQDIFYALGMKLGEISKALDEEFYSVVEDPSE